MSAGSRLARIGIHRSAALENRYATKLFDRVGCRIAFTEAGRQFLVEAKVPKDEMAKLLTPRYGFSTQPL